MNSSSDLLHTLFSALGWDDPKPWQIAVLFVVVLLLVLPLLQKNARTDKARKMVKALPDTPNADRPAIQEAALKTVWDHPEGLVAIADEAFRLGLHTFAEQIVARLKETGRKTDELRRLQRDLAGDAPVMPEQVVVQVEAMLEHGMVDAARGRLGPALLRWPDHPDLLELDARLRGELTAPVPESAASSVEEGA